MPEAHYERILKAQELIANKLEFSTLPLIGGQIYLKKEEANEILSAFR